MVQGYLYQSQQSPLPLPTSTSTPTSTSLPLCIHICPLSALTWECDLYILHSVGQACSSAVSRSPQDGAQIGLGVFARKVGCCGIHYPHSPSRVCREVERIGQCAQAEREQQRCLHRSDCCRPRLPTTHRAPTWSMGERSNPMLDLDLLTNSSHVWKLLIKRTHSNRIHCKTLLVSSPIIGR
jgi:hypothetical protein